MTPGVLLPGEAVVAEREVCPVSGRRTKPLGSGNPGPSLPLLTGAVAWENSEHPGSPVGTAPILAQAQLAPPYSLPLPSSPSVLRL